MEAVDNESNSTDLVSAGDIAKLEAALSKPDGVSKLPDIANHFNDRIIEESCNLLIRGILENPIFSEIEEPDGYSKKDPFNGQFYNPSLIALKTKDNLEALEINSPGLSPQDRLNFVREYLQRTPYVDLYPAIKVMGLETLIILIGTLLRSENDPSDELFKIFQVVGAILLALTSSVVFVHRYKLGKDVMRTLESVPENTFELLYSQQGVEVSEDPQFVLTFLEQEIPVIARQYREEYARQIESVSLLEHKLGTTKSSLDRDLPMYDELLSQLQLNEQRISRLSERHQARLSYLDELESIAADNAAELKDLIDRRDRALALEEKQKQALIQIDGLGQDILRAERELDISEAETEISVVSGSDLTDQISETISKIRDFIDADFELERI